MADANNGNEYQGWKPKTMLVKFETKEEFSEFKTLMDHMRTNPNARHSARDVCDAIYQCMQEDF